MLMILWIVGALVAIIVLAMLLVPMFIDEQALLELQATLILVPSLCCMSVLTCRFGVCPSSFAWLKRLLCLDAHLVPI